MILGLGPALQIQVRITGVGKKCLQLRPFSILAGGFVLEDSVDVEVLELSAWVLIITADPVARVAAARC